MDFKLAGKVALVTGSSRGIGLATAKAAFATEGCRVMLSARSIEQLREAETVLRTTGAEVAAHAGDVGNPDHARGLIRATVAAFGGIDILVNNVGGGGGGARIADSTDDDWRGALERNLVQTVRMMRLALPHLQGRPGAAVINVASISGWLPQLAMSGQYGAAKAALLFDDLAGAREGRWRYRQPKRLGGFEIDDQSNLVGCSAGAETPSSHARGEACRGARRPPHTRADMQLNALKIVVHPGPLMSRIMSMVFQI
jgi:hypothetical protein